MQSSPKSATAQPDTADARFHAGMRRLILIRHAKAVEEDIGGDHARGLSERGTSDAAALGEWLKAQGLIPDIVLCSTATRTRQTLAAVAPNIPTILADKLYLASAQDMLVQIQAMDDAVNILMLIGHNPGCHALACMLAGDFAAPQDADTLLLKFPTSACAVIDFSAQSWHDIAPDRGRLTLLRF